MKWGAKVKGAGTETITIASGAEKLHGMTHKCSPRPYRSGTLYGSYAMTGGDVS